MREGRWADQELTLERAEVRPKQLRYQVQLIGCDFADFCSQSQTTNFGTPAILAIFASDR